jgi:hypothetical protein
LTGGEPEETARVLALIDFGSERTLAAPGMLLGQSGFFDRFTVTFWRRALAFGIEPVKAFDERFADAIGRVERAQMEGTIDGLGWSDG